MKKLKIITTIISILCMLIYEFIFCNLYNINNGKFYFSTFRLITYLVLGLLFWKFSNKFIEEAITSMKKKKSLIITYVVAIIMYTVYIIIKKEEIWKIFKVIMIELSGLLFILYLSKDYIKNIVVTTITLGIMFSSTSDFFHIMDEKQHFNTALNLASGNFNYQIEPLGDRKFQDITREIPMQEFVMKYSNIKYKMKMEKVEFDEVSIPMTYNPLLYLPSALGINLARFFGGSMLDVFLAGRIANLIFFMGLLIAIFKILPFRKDTFYCIYLLPQAMALAASYSMDAITVGLVGIFIAYVLKIYKENQDGINIKQCMLLIVLFMIALLSKLGAYLGICIVILILPIMKSIKKDKRLLFIIGTVILIAVGLGLYRFNSIVKTTKGDIKMEEANPKAQLEFVLSDIKRFKYVYKNCLNNTIFDLDYYEGLNLKKFMGSEYKIVTWALFIFCVYTATNDGTHNFKKKEKIIMILAFAATFFCGTMLMYLWHTPYMALTIIGYQARYLIPILPLLLMCLYSKAENQEEEYNTTAKNMVLFMVLNLISKTMS